LPERPLAEPYSCAAHQPPLVHFCCESNFLARRSLQCSRQICPPNLPRLFPRSPPSPLLSSPQPSAVCWQGCQGGSASPTLLPFAAFLDRKSTMEGLSFAQLNWSILHLPPHPPLDSSLSYEAVTLSASPAFPCPFPPSCQTLVCAETNRMLAFSYDYC